MRIGASRCLMAHRFEGSPLSAPRLHTGNRDMLVLTRKLMEKLFIGDDICVTVVRLEGGQVRLGIDAPREVAVVRAELVPERSAPRPRTARSVPGPPAGTGTSAGSGGNRTPPPHAHTPADFKTPPPLLAHGTD